MYTQPAAAGLRLACLYELRVASSITDVTETTVPLERQCGTYWDVRLDVSLGQTVINCASGVCAVICKDFGLSIQPEHMISRRRSYWYFLEHVVAAWLSAMGTGPGTDCLLYGLIISQCCKNTRRRLRDTKDSCQWMR